MKARVVAPTLLGLILPTLHAAEDGMEFFEKRIRPALVEHCYDCHSAEAKKIKGGLRLDIKAGWEKGGDSGPSIVPGKPEDSLFIKAVRRLDKDLAMPPKTELPAAVVDDFIAWVKMGAPDPRTDVAIAASETAKKPAIDFVEARKKWAYSVPAQPTVPEVANTVWPQNDLDKFILSRLEKEKIPPAPRAEPSALIRRLSFDLTGLPPTPEQAAAFEKDSISNQKSAISNATESLIASPAYGEKWGRHWLDVVRYADSLDARGSGKEGDIMDAWRYRDWVASAFNRDLPYDEFIRQQVAGDLLAARTWDAQKVVATGVFAIGNWGNGDSDKQKVYSDIVDDQIDVVGRAFMGLTVTCARCHDHKFDPIGTADYYALSGFFFSSHIIEKFAAPTAGEGLMRISLLSPEEKKQREEAQRRIAEIDARLAQAMTPLADRKQDVAGKPGLTGWTPKGRDNPSLTVNRTGDDVKITTVSIPRERVSLHPGPKTPVTAVWRSPIHGNVKIEAHLRDADPNCGDGIAWELRSAAQVLGKGEMTNGGTADSVQESVAVDEGQLVRLVVKPRGEYTCDSTLIDFIVSATDGRRWDFRTTLLSGEEPGAGAWLVCEGDAEKLGKDEESIRGLDEERKKLAAGIDSTPRAQGLQDGGIPGTAYAGFHDARIHVRGSYARLAEVQPRGFPALFAAPAPKIEGSGRLALAEWLASAEHPLTARVMVNRIWQHHFGEGLVRTPNNFGKLGDPPSHPELLDWLAHRFVESGWSIKAMHRLICTSATYQQSSRASADSMRIDPSNRLLSHQNRRKLSAEDLRDALLAAAGKLDRKVGGVSIPDIGSPRRTLYLTTVRSDRSSYRMLFDGADPGGIIEKRTDSVVAPQALWLLNHPFTLTRATDLANELSRAVPTGTAARTDWLWRRLFARAPRADEIILVEKTIAASSTDPRTWERICHALLCSNEFLFVE